MLQVDRTKCYSLRNGGEPRGYVIGDKAGFMWPSLERGDSVDRSNVVYIIGCHIRPSELRLGLCLSLECLSVMTL